MNESDSKLGYVISEENNELKQDTLIPDNDKEYQSEKIRIEIQEAISDSVDKRLRKFEKRRSRIKRHELIGKIFKWGIIICLLLTIYFSPALRNKVVLIVDDVIEMIQDATNNKDVSSNKLVEDIFKPIGGDLEDDK